MKLNQTCTNSSVSPGQHSYKAIMFSSLRVQLLLDLPISGVLAMRRATSTHVCTHLPYCSLSLEQQTWSETKIRLQFAATYHSTRAKASLKRKECVLFSEARVESQTIEFKIRYFNNPLSRVMCKVLLVQRDFSAIILVLKLYQVNSQISIKL